MKKINNELHENSFLSHTPVAHPTIKKYFAPPKVLVH